jgi:predicted TIM-barrel fold metal-dependent hydrolase
LRHRACSCEVDVNTTQWLQEAKWVQKYATTLSAGGPQIGAILAQPPPGFGTQPVTTFSALLDELQLLPLVRGLRPQIPSVADSLFHAAMREAGHRGLVIDVNHGYQPPSSRLLRGSAVGGVVEEIAAAAPNTTFVIEHMWGAPGMGSAAADGAVADWKAALKALARYCRGAGVSLFACAGMLGC